MIHWECYELKDKVRGHDVLQYIDSLGDRRRKSLPACWICGLVDPRQTYASTLNSRQTYASDAASKETRVLQLKGIPLVCWQTYASQTANL